MYYVYLIRKSGKFYIGYTENLRRRLLEHRISGKNLIYCEAYKSEEDARERERKLKQRGQAVRRLKQRLTRSIRT